MGERREVDKNVVRARVAQIPGLEACIRTHCSSARVQFQYSDFELLRLGELELCHLQRGLPTSVGWLTVPTPQDPSPCGMGSIFVIFKKDDGVTGGGWIPSLEEVRISKGQSIRDVVGPERVDCIFGVVAIWTEKRRSLLSDTVLTVRHWVEVFCRLRPNDW